MQARADHGPVCAQKTALGSKPRGGGWLPLHSLARVASAPPSTASKLDVPKLKGGCRKGEVASSEIC